MKKKLPLLILLLFLAVFYSHAQSDNSAQSIDTLLNEYVNYKLSNYDVADLTNREIEGIKYQLKSLFFEENEELFIEYNSRMGGFSTNPVSQPPQIGNPINQIVGNLFSNNCSSNFSHVVINSSISGAGVDESFESLGSFNNGDGSIPFTSGMILSTGFLNNASGPNNMNINLSDGVDAGVNSWYRYAHSLFDNYGLPNETYRNGTDVQFKFTPITNHISFDFAFLSEEYNQNFECAFGDLFIFILENDATGSQENLAIVPNANTPVQVTSIRPNIYNQSTQALSCDEVNQDYFSHYNWNLSYNPHNVNTISENASPTAYNGQTKVFTAFGNVIPNQSYTITLAIADFSDEKFDAAVLIGDGTFNTGINLGPDVTVCDGQDVILSTAAISNASYQWAQLNGSGNYINISGANGNAYTATEAGDYQLTVTVNGCTMTDSIIVTESASPVAQTPDDITVCDENPNDGFAEFDLTSVSGDIQNGQPGTTVSYHLSQADADNNVGPLPTMYTNTTANQQTVYARLTNNEGCYDTVSFDIIVDADCCTTVSCPDVSINKQAIGSILTGTDYEPGDIITYSITITNNEPETTCPFTFDITDEIDTTILDEDTFNASSFGVNFNPNTDTVSINNISISSGASTTYTFSFQIFEATLAESIENCANISIKCIGNVSQYESCVITQIEQPDSIWPRTYSGDNQTIAGRYSEDVAVDEDGNVYTIGNIDIGDVSDEDPTFISDEIGYIMKHDYFGNLVWITSISNTYHNIKDNGLIKYYNHKLHVFTNKGFYLQYNDDGSFINGSAYETRLYQPAISMNAINGNIVIAGTYYSNFSNTDFSVNANSNRPAGVIIKFGPTGLGGNHDYITHQTFMHNGNSGRSSINFYDAVYAEDTNRIFLTGYSKGNRVFPNGQLANYTYGKSIIVTLKDNGNSLDMTHNAYIQYNTLYPYIEYKNSSNKIYITTATGRLYEIPFSEFGPGGFGQRTFIDNIFENDSFVRDMVINQETGNLFSIGDRFGNGEISKVSPQGRVWNHEVDYLQPKAIAVGPLNHYFITGNYTDDTTLNLGISINTSPIYAYGSPAHHDNIFTARFKDYGSGGVFRKQDENGEALEETINNFLVYPNPSAGNISVKKAETNDSYKTVSISIRDFSGKIVFMKENVDTSLVNTYNLEDLKTGLYFMEIINSGKSIEVHKLMISK